MTKDETMLTATMEYVEHVRTLAAEVRDEIEGGDWAAEDERRSPRVFRCRGWDQVGTRASRRSCGASEFVPIQCQC